MKTKMTLAFLATALSATAVVPDMATARTRHVYHGRNVHHRCHGGNGAVGTVAGGAGGAVLGHAVLGGPVATIAGGVGGALLGRHLDKKNTKHRRGC